MDLNTLSNCLKERDFIGIDKIDSIARCNKHLKHWLLVTDGIIIYSNIPNYKNAQFLKDAFYEFWNLEDFSIDKLDSIIETIESLGVAKPITPMI